MSLFSLINEKEKYRIMLEKFDSNKNKFQRKLLFLLKGVRA